MPPVKWILNITQTILIILLINPTWSKGKRLLWTGLLQGLLPIPSEKTARLFGGLGVIMLSQCLWDLSTLRIPRAERPPADLRIGLNETLDLLLH